MNIVPHHNAWMHGSHNFSIKSDLVGAAQWCVYERPFVNMHILSNKEAPNVSIDQWKSFFSLLTQTGLWVKWSNCPFYQPSPPHPQPPPLYSSDHWLRLRLSISESLTRHTSPHTLIPLRDKTIISASKAWKERWDELLHLHTSIDCLKKGWILATSMRKVFTIHTHLKKWNLYIPDCSEEYKYQIVLFPQSRLTRFRWFRGFYKKHPPSLLKDLN